MISFWYSVRTQILGSLLRMVSFINVWNRGEVLAQNIKRKMK